MGQGCGAFKYLLLARDDLSGWVEGKAFKKIGARAVLAFFGAQILGRYGPILDVVVNDNGRVFRGEYAKWVEKLEFDHRTSTPYNPRAHGAIERGHPQIFEALCKASTGKYHQWHTYLHAVLYADRITTKRTTGFSPFELVFGAVPCLPLDVDLETWVYTDWKVPMSTAELLYQRTRQIVRSAQMTKVAALRLARARRASAVYMDGKMAHRMQDTLKVNDLVLVHDTALSTAFTRKMDNRWYGPFVVIGQHEKGSYQLAELDGTPRVSLVAPSRLRRYYPGTRRQLTDIQPELLMPASARAPDLGHD